MNTASADDIDPKKGRERLLLLHHASKCTAEDGTCTITPQCAEMKVLWEHITSCKEVYCNFHECMSSRYVISHYRQCKSPCNICDPVKEIINNEFNNYLEVESPKERKEEPKDAAALLDDLVEIYDSIPEVDDVYSARLEQMIHSLYTELKSVESPQNQTFGVVLDYWSSCQSKYQALFSNHPLAAHIIWGLLENVVCSSAHSSTGSIGDAGERVISHVFFLLQCQDEHTPLDSIMSNYDQHCRSGDINFQEFVSWYPVYGAWHNALYSNKPPEDIIQTLSNAQNTAKDQLESVRGPYISISFVVSDVAGASASVKKCTVTSSMLLKWICRAYARVSNVPLKSIRFTHEGRILFLSEGNKTVGELGLNHLSVINVSILDQSATDTVKDQVVVSSKPKSKPKSSKSKKKKGDRKNGNKKKKSASNNCYSLMSDGQKHRQLHSKALSKVFEEAESSKFFSIRQGLNAMNLECMKPKAKKASTKQPTISQSIDNPPTSGFGGKAGKSHVFVQVGEESNLYKTSKPLSNRSNQRSSSRSATSKAIVIDLHGLAKKAALDKLDKALPVWIDMAMKDYPFVRTVKIIHGGGNQVLEEVVASWIKQNRQVANAPKSMCM